MAEATDTAYRFGIEEEFFLADAATRGTPDGDAARAFHKTVAEKIEGAGRENLQSQVEIQTPPAERAVQALEGLSSARATLTSLAREQGLVVFASGTHPNSCWPDQNRSQGERYDRMVADYGILASRNMVCALHVHVELPDPSRRALLMRRMVPYLPLFLALSASSPFWDCRDTGLKSYRMAAYQEWPRSGLPDLMGDEADYARYLSVMIRSGAIPDESYLWWAIRPLGKLPTLELRVCDSCASVEDSVAIASLYRCVIRMLERKNEVHAGLTGGSRAIASENLWRVQQHGAEATLIDEASPRCAPWRSSSTCWPHCRAGRGGIGLSGGAGRRVCNRAPRHRGRPAEGHLAAGARSGAGRSTIVGRGRRHAGEHDRVLRVPPALRTFLIAAP
jgi:carboxylate-amine ligase